MFYFITNNYQTNHNAKNWQTVLERKEIERNNFHATGNIKKAKEFVKLIERFNSQVTFVQPQELPLFSKESLAVPLYITN
ncbi:MAG TPA: hypothetical protein VLF93_05785 [Candidatus Saccharimonadales bacterium]|nr:hypothetical protein [Candidatus Saccharimonadales bacterium]